MMNGLKKSDEAIRPVRAANKGARASAESPEERASTKGNPDCQITRRTQCRVSVPQAAARIRKAAERNPKERLTALFHHITPDALHRAFHALKRDAAAGVDGVTWNKYGEGLEERLLDLHRRLHTGGAYRAPPVRRVEIPKPDGGTRPLGIAALEDKIVQKAVVDVILTPIYEVEFLGFSYGFRPGRGAHDALDALAFGIERRKVSWIVDADIRAYFDTIPRDWLMTFLEHRIGDPVVATKLSLKSLARRILDINDEIAELDRFIVPLVEELVPSLLELEGVGTENAGAVMVAVGDNPDRLRSEASFAMMCGVCPIPASSGKTQRHRLNRGGNRQANSALHMVVVCRMRTDERTRAYVARRTLEGLSKREIMRCLKRYVAREIYRVLTAPSSA